LVCKSFARIMKKMMKKKTKYWNTKSWSLPTRFDRQSGGFLCGFKTPSESKGFQKSCFVLLNLILLRLQKSRNTM